MKGRSTSRTCSLALFALFFGALAATVVPARSGASEVGPTLSFGVVPQQSATRLARSWVPLFSLLAQRTGLKLRFATAPDIPTFEVRLAKGEYDLAYMNPYHYTVFHQQPGYEAFARERDRRIKGIVVVRADSPLQTLEELAGETLAFPAPAAFAASVLPRARLRRLEIPFEAKYVSSHDSVYRSVAAGLHPAGGGITRTFEKVDSGIRSQLRVLWTSRGYTPHAFAAHPRVDADVVRTLREAMRALDTDEQGRAALRRVGFKGIEPAADADWNDIRELGLDLLDELIRE